MGKVLLVVLPDGCWEWTQGGQDGVRDPKSNLRFRGQWLREVDDEVLVTAMGKDSLVSQELPKLPGMLEMLFANTPVSSH